MGSNFVYLVAILLTLQAISQLQCQRKKAKKTFLPRCKMSKPSAFVNVASGRCIATLNAGTSDYTPLILFDCDSANPGQLWTAVYAAQGLYNIVGNGSSRCVDDLGDNTADGAQIGIYGCVPTAVNHRWTFEPIKPPVFQLVGNGSGKCAAPKGGAKDNGTPIVIATCDKSAAQSWKLNTGKGPGAAAGNGVSKGAASKGRCALWRQATVPGQTKTNRTG